MRSILPKKSFHGLAHVILCFLNRNSCLEPRRHSHTTDVVAGGWIGLKRKPDVSRRVRGETASEHPNHLVRLIFQPNGSAYRGGIAAEMPVPQAIADHCHARTARPVFLPGEGTAGRHLCAEETEVVR